MVILPVILLLKVNGRDTLAFINSELDTMPAAERRALIKQEVKKTLRKSLIPGIAQIRNRQYWKLPVYYGGYVALTSMAIKHYSAFKNDRDSYVDNYSGYFPYSYRYLGDRVDESITINPGTNLVEKHSEFENIHNGLLRSRNLSYFYIGSVGFLYMLNLCDAINPVYKGYRSPYKAAVYSAMIPGLGQIYNRQGWKAPLAYIGFGTFAFFINFTHVQYKKYLDAYFIRIDTEAKEYAISYYNRYFDPYEPDFWEKNNIKKGEYYKLGVYQRVYYYNDTQLLREKDRFKRYRDLNILGFCALYAVNIIDAYVNSHLYDFDVSDDISFDIKPFFFNNPKEAVNIGMTLAFNF